MWRLRVVARISRKPRQGVRRCGGYVAEVWRMHPQRSKPYPVPVVACGGKILRREGEKGKSGEVGSLVLPLVVQVSGERLRELFEAVALRSPGPCPHGSRDDPVIPQPLGQLLRGHGQTSVVGSP